MTTKNSNKNIYIWKPGLLIKIGVGLNIVFCSILSILVVTLPITIPSIVFNALLLVPVTSDKPRNYASRLIPMLLTIILAAILAVVVLFAVTSLEGALNWFVDIINKYILFWGPSLKLDALDITYWLDIYMIIILVLGSVGSAFIFIGGYNKKDLNISIKSNDQK